MQKASLTEQTNLHSSVRCTDGNTVITIMILIVELPHTVSFTHLYTTDHEMCNPVGRSTDHMDVTVIWSMCHGDPVIRMRIEQLNKL